MCRGIDGNSSLQWIYVADGIVTQWIGAARGYIGAVKVTLLKVSQYEKWKSGKAIYRLLHVSINLLQGSWKQRHRQVGESAASYAKCPGFKSRLEDRLYCLTVFGIFFTTSSKCRHSTSNRPWPLPSTCFPTYCSQFTPLLKTLLNKWAPLTVCVWLAKLRRCLELNTAEAWNQICTFK
jgi:hypothetical protein